MVEVQLNNIGTIFKVKIKDQDGEVVDVSTATTKQIIFRKPGGDPLTKTASFTTDGTDGYIQYTSEADDLNELGIWELQTYVVVSPSEWYGLVLKFRVLRNSKP